MPSTHTDVPLAKPSLADDLDALAKRRVQNDAANDESPERRQLEILLSHALKETDADYAFVLSPAGQGAYAEQFARLAAVVQRANDGQIHVCHDYLASRRPDPMILSVMRLRRPVSGQPSDIGLPTCLPGSHPPINYFIMLPIADGVSRTSILFVANPSSTRLMQGSAGMIDTLERLIKILRHQQQSQENQPAIATIHGDDLGARHYVQLMSAAINAVVITDARGVITAFNPAAETLFGRDSARALGTSLDTYLPQEFLMPILKRSQSFNAPSEAYDILPVNRRSVTAMVDSGHYVHLVCSSYFTRVADKVYTTFVFDHESESALLHDTSTTHQQFKALTNVAPVGIVQLGEDWTCEYANDMWCQLSGLSMDETLGSGWIDAIHAEDVVNALVQLRETLSENQIFSHNLRLQRPTGRVSWVTLSATVTVSESGHFNGCLLVLLDVTEAHLASEKLRFAASHDVLTGLANRSAFLDRLQERLNSPQKRVDTALMYLDLDGFKSINDTLGHDCGDELLREVANRIRATVGARDLCARLGGDEFTIIVTSWNTSEEVCNLAERIVRGFSETFHVFDNELYLSTSIGIAFPDAQTISSDAFIKQADTALYKAKSSGRSRWVVYTEQFQQEDVERSVLQAGVRRAIEHNEFILAYQPQFCVSDKSIVGFEALLRWYPSDIPVPDTQLVVECLEDNGLINEVGQWVIEAACQQYRDWELAGLLPEGCSMSVNVSPVQLSLANFAPRLRAILNRCQMPADKLNLELTESAVIEKNSASMRVIEQIKAMGVGLTLDDFGTGYASLSYLTQLPIDTLKIDRSFILDMEHNEPSRAIVMSVLAMANTLDIDVVAEGIENRGTLERLRTTNCKYAQGYFLCKPEEAGALEDLLRSQSTRHREVSELH